MTGQMNIFDWMASDSYSKTPSAEEPIEDEVEQKPVNKCKDCLYFKKSDGLTYCFLRVLMLPTDQINPAAYSKTYSETIACKDIIERKKFYGNVR